MHPITRALAACLICVCLSHPAWSFHVVIDPGHGGTDQGAVRGPLREAEIVLGVSLELQKLIAENKQMQSSLTRTDNKLSLNLSQRASRVNEAKGDILVSIHANASEDSRAKGVEFYFQNQLPPDEETLFYASRENQLLKETEESDEGDAPSQNADLKLILEDLGKQTRMQRSHKLTQNLLSAWPEADGSRNQVVRQAPFHMVTKVNVPAVLIELGFISHPQEGQKLRDPAFQKQLAQKIYAGIQSYQEVLDKPAPASLH